MFTTIVEAISGAFHKDNTIPRDARGRGAYEASTLKGFLHPWFLEPLVIGHHRSTCFSTVSDHWRHWYAALLFRGAIGLGGVGFRAKSFSLEECRVSEFLGIHTLLGRGSTI